MASGEQRSSRSLRLTNWILSSVVFPYHAWFTLALLHLTTVPAIHVKTFHTLYIVHPCVKLLLMAVWIFKMWCPPLPLQLYLVSIYHFLYINDPYFTFFHFCSENEAAYSKFTKLRDVRPHCRWWIFFITGCGWLRFETAVLSSTGPCKKCQKLTANFTVVKSAITSLSFWANPIERWVYA